MRFTNGSRFDGTVLGLAAFIAATAGLLMPAPDAGSQEVGTDCKVTEKELVEIYRIAPGRHEAFLRAIASYDRANELAGLPPRKLYVHSDGTGWDFLLIQPTATPPGKAEALDAAWEKLQLPSGAKFFLTFRENSWAQRHIRAWSHECGRVPGIVR